MLLTPDKKKTAALIVAKFSKPSSADSESDTSESDSSHEEDDSSDMMPSRCAADDLKKALDSGDSKAIVEAFKSLYELVCGGDSESMDDNEDPTDKIEQALRKANRD